jgi:integrase
VTRRRLPPNVSRAPSGRYEVRVMIAGKRIKRRFDRAADADEFRAELKKAAAYRSLGLAPPPGKERPFATLNEVCAGYVRYLERSGASHYSIASARYYARTILDGLGSARPVPLAEEDILELMGWIRSHKRTKGTLLKHVLQFVRTSHRRAKLPVPPTPPVEVEEGGRRLLSVAELVRFLGALPPASIERAVAYTILLTGARATEVYRMRRSDVDFDAGTITLTQRKGWRTSAVRREAMPMLPELARELRAYLAAADARRPGDWLFTLSYAGTKKPQHLFISSLAARLIAASERAGIKPPIYGLAFLRNQLATLLDEEGEDTRTIQRILRHRALATTEIYARAGRRTQREAALKRAAAVIRAGQLRAEADPGRPH